MDIILVIGIFEALFLALLLLLKKNSSRSDRYLAAYFLIFAINAGLMYIENFNRANSYPYQWAINTTAPLILLHGPAIWFYIRSQTGKRMEFRFIQLAHFIPFLTMVIFESVTLWFLPPEKKIYVASNYLFKDTPAYFIFISMIGISPVVYFLWGLAMLRDYNRKLKNRLSRIGGYDYRWLRTILLSAILVYSVINLFFIIDIFIPVAPFGMMQLLSFVTGSVLILFLGFYGHRQTNVFVSGNPDNSMDIFHGTPENSDVVSASQQKIKELLEIMQVEKPHLDPGITLDSLSRVVEMSADKLSALLNRDLNKNFFDFINHFRVEEFKARVKDSSNDNYSLIGIAYDCGFSSKATFMRVFKTHTGYTPGEYKKMVSGQ